MDYASSPLGSLFCGAVTHVGGVSLWCKRGTTDRSTTMTGSDKAYSAPHLESLSLRSTRDIDVHLGVIGVHVDLHVGLGGLLS
jgi:hypothetical protein